MLPSIQRKFVWDTERIINLFDLLMQCYPIGTMMVLNFKCKKNDMNYVNYSPS